jgi:anti-sigma regulatory factor (Ser/Thr protein kinase)
MRSGAATGYSGYFHEAAFFGSDDELLSIVIPFLRDGVAHDEPTIVALSDRNTDLVRTHVAELDAIQFLPDGYLTPAATIRTYTDEFTKLVGSNAAQIRVVGEVPHSDRDTRWESWGRYEAVINHAFKAFPVWGLCPYDTRTAPSNVLEDVARTHQHVASIDGGHRVNPLYQDPAKFLRERPQGADATPTDPPDLRLDNPTPRAARAALERLLSPCLLSDPDVHNVQLAVAELVTNATIHGAPPVILRAWASTPRRVIVAITDQGKGVTDPFAGLLPRSPDEMDGRGLWISHQVCTDICLQHDEHGFSAIIFVGKTPSDA